MKKTTKIIIAFITILMLLNIMPFSITKVNASNVTVTDEVFEDFFLTFPDTYLTTKKQIDFQTIEQEVTNQLIEYIKENNLILDDYVIDVEIYPINTMIIKVYKYMDNVSSTTTENDRIKFLVAQKDDIYVMYSNDSAGDSEVEEKIYNMVENIVPVYGEFELDSTYDGQLRAYSIDEILNNKTGLNLQVINLNKENDIAGFFYKMRVISVAIGYNDFVYYMGNAAVLQSSPVITLPDSLEASNDVYLEYATQRVKDYMSSSNINFELVSVEYDDTALNQIDVTLQNTVNGISVTHSENIKLRNMKTMKQGDINADGLVDSADAAIALNLFKYNNATESDLELGDMNEDGLIDSADAAIILNIFKYSN